MAASSKKSVKPKQFYEIETRGGTSHAWELVNGNRLQADHVGLLPKIEWPDGWRATTKGPWTLPKYLEPPKFRVDRKIAKKFKDYEGGWVSTRMKELIENIAPGACLFERCEIEFDGGEPGPEFWLWSVNKVFQDAADVSKSKNVRLTEDGRYIFPNIVERYLFSFRNEVVSGEHLFRLVEYWIPTFCDDDFMKACTERKLTGIYFRKTGQLI